MTQVYIVFKTTCYPYPQNYIDKEIYGIYTTEEAAVKAVKSVLDSLRGTIKDGDELLESSDEFTIYYDDYDAGYTGAFIEHYPVQT